VSIKWGIVGGTKVTLKKNGSTNKVGISFVAMANFEMKGELEKMLRETMWKIGVQNVPLS
jgi:hypothetical protein